jgi:hypothetical protein
MVRSTIGGIWYSSLCLGRSLVASLLLLSLGSCASSSGDTATTLDELIRRHTEARSGRVAIEAITILEDKIRIVEPTYTADGLWRVNRSGRMRIDVFIGDQRVWTEGFDGKIAWQFPGGAVRAQAAEAGAAALRHSALLPTNILGLHEMSNHGARLEYLGREDVGGVSYYVVVLTLDDGFATRYYLDPSSYLIARSRVRKALHPDADPTPTTIETVWSDFAKWRGSSSHTVQPIAISRRANCSKLTTILEITVNPVVDNHLFEMR